MATMAADKTTTWTPDAIRTLRESLGLTVDDAAARIHVSPRVWFYWEAGTRKPSRSTALLLDLLKRKKI